MVRGDGLNSDRINRTMDNTEIDRAMNLTLFGRDVELAATEKDDVAASDK